MEVVKDERKLIYYQEKCHNCSTILNLNHNVVSFRCICGKCQKVTKSIKLVAPLNELDKFQICPQCKRHDSWSDVVSKRGHQFDNVDMIYYHLVRTCKICDESFEWIYQKEDITWN